MADRRELILTNSSQNSYAAKKTGNFTCLFCWWKIIDLHRTEELKKVIIIISSLICNFSILCFAAFN